MAMKAKAVPFIVPNEGDESSSFHVTEEAKALLSTFEGPLSVIAVAGLFRTGKSFLLNRLLGRQAAFDVGGTVEACTIGISLWSEPLVGRTAEGEECRVIVLDTEGLGSLDKNEEYDARVFSLAALLCSTLIFNSMGTIDEKTISRLSFIASLTKHIRSQVNVGDSPATSVLSRFFPSLLWVLRDFSLALTDEYGDEKEASEYLEECLEAKDGFSAEIAESNHTRGVLRAFFPRRDCVTLVRPIDDEAQLQSLTEQPWESLREEFRIGLGEVQTKVLGVSAPAASAPASSAGGGSGVGGGATIKMVEGKRLDGAMLADLATAYVRVLSASPSEEDADAGAAGGGGGMPTIMSAWESVCSAQNRRAADAARTAWRRCAEATEATLPQPPSALEATLSASRAAQLGAFDSSVSSAAAAAMLRATLGAEIDAAVVRLAAQNDELADVMCAKLLVTLHGTEGGAAAKIDGVAATPYATMAEYMAGDYEILRAAYVAAGFGPTCEAQLRAHLRKTLRAVSTKCAEVAAREAEGAIDAIELKAHEAETKAAQAAAKEEVLLAELGRLDAEAAETKAQVMKDEARLASEEDAAKELRNDIESEQARRAAASVKLAAVQSAHSELATRVGTLAAGLSANQEKITAAMKRKQELALDNQRLTAAVGEGEVET